MAQTPRPPGPAHGDASAARRRNASRPPWQARLSRFEAACFDDAPAGLRSDLETTRQLGPLARLGLRSDLLSALTLVPLVHLAWCDGSLEPAERDAVLRGADAAGLERESAGYRLLEHWLGGPPSEALLRGWRALVVEMVADLPISERRLIRDNVLALAREVAEAAGGVFGLGRVSRPERRALAELERAFDGSGEAEPA